MQSDELTEDTTERQLRFNLNPQLRTIASNMDEPIEQLIGVFEKTLSNAFHNKPNAIKPLNSDDVNKLPVKDYAQHITATYLQSPQLHDRDIHQIRFILAMYDGRANLSDDAYHDVVSQVILFYHDLLYGWSVATTKCKDILVKPKLFGVEIDFKQYRAHVGKTTAIPTTTRSRNASRQRKSRGRPSKSPKRSTSNNKRAASRIRKYPAAKNQARGPSRPRK